MPGAERLSRVSVRHALPNAGTPGKILPGASVIRLHSPVRDTISSFPLRFRRLQRATCQDTTPPAVPGVPEVREYQAIAVVDDAEVGTPGDPKVVVYAGQLAA